MKSVDRFEAYEGKEFDELIRDIQVKRIRAGRFAHLIKVKNHKINKEDIFDARRDSDSEDE